MTITTRLKTIEEAVKNKFVKDKPCKMFLLDKDKPTEYAQQLKEIEQIKADDSADLIIINFVRTREELNAN